MSRYFFYLSGAVVLFSTVAVFLSFSRLHLTYLRILSLFVAVYRTYSLLLCCLMLRFLLRHCLSCLLIFSRIWNTCCPFDSISFRSCVVMCNFLVLFALSLTSRINFAGLVLSFLCAICNWCLGSHLFSFSMLLSCLFFYQVLLFLLCSRLLSYFTFVPSCVTFFLSLPHLLFLMGYIHHVTPSQLLPFHFKMMS